MADKHKSMGSKIFGSLITLLFIGAGIAIVSYIVACYLSLKTIIWDSSILQSGTFLSIFLVCFLLYIMYVLLKLGDKKPSSEAKVKTKDDKKKYYDTEWLSKDELKKNPNFKFHTYEQLSKSTNIGIPIRAELIGNTLNINMYKSIHTLVIGTTGSGKTTQFVDPTMQILGESKAQPCLVITDPKGEIYEHHSAKLRKKGYRVMVFDLKEPFQSTCWNPMDRSYELNQKAIHLNDEVKTHSGEDPRKSGLKLVSTTYYNEWYEFEGLAFGDKPTLDGYISSLKQKLKNEAFEDLRDLASTLCPIQSQQDPIWERGAKDLVLGTMMAMLEDSEDARLGMTRDKFNFFNLSKILNIKDNDPYNPIKSLVQYFQGRDPLSLATQLANQVITNAEKTAKSYMGIVTDRMGIFSDTGICYATSKNDMDLKSFCDMPTALFIKIPDEKTTRHPIATMFVSQLYKILVDVANKKGGSLPKDTYFILDEFGNMPKIENFETIITVARSRRIFFTLILQSYAQLSIKYGDDVSSTVKDNCNIHIFIASNDQNTLEEFSKKCGTTSVETESVSSSKAKKEEGSSTTTSVNIDTRPLIYPSELASMKPNSGECIVYILQQNPLKSVFTPSYKCKAYDMTPTHDEFKLPEPFNETAIYYDIRKRNQIVFNSNAGGNNGAPRPMF